MIGAEAALAQQVMRQLLLVWLAFERDLEGVPILARLKAGTFTRADYRLLLLNLRQQVIEGARWITRAASSFDREHSDLRALAIAHAADEHRDYEILERDFVAAGGDAEVLRAKEKNIGSEALDAFLTHRASQPNPIDCLGAMFIIEGLGEKMASDWAVRIRDLTSLPEEATRFLSYHGANDAAHLERLTAMLESGHLTEAIAARIVKTARVTARLYRLQLEELDAE